MINFYELVQPFVSGLRTPSNEKLVKPDGTINEMSIKAALNLGFPDITPRTMADRDKEYKEKGKREFADMPDALFGYRATDQLQTFGDMLKTWFEKTHVDWKADFKTLHANACDTVLSFLKEQLYGNNSCTYGKAQKVVNMTFKHLYCLSEGKKREWFLECHMALDFFTLEWFKRDIAQYGKVYTLGKIDNWSALQNPEGEEYEGKKGQKFYCYHFLTDKIREHFDKKRPFGPLCPLEAEFIIWPNVQTRLSAESFIFQLDPEKYGENAKNADENKKAVKDLPIDKLIATAEAEITKYRAVALPLTTTPEYREHGYKMTYCPVCGSRTLDSNYICNYCHWEYDGVTEEDTYSSSNGMTIAEYRNSWTDSSD